MMENLDWDRAHTIEEEDEDSPEGVLEEHKARKASNIQIGDVNGGDDLNKRRETDDQFKLVSSDPHLHSKVSSKLNNTVLNRGPDTSSSV